MLKTSSLGTNQIEPRDLVHVQKGAGSNLLALLPFSAMALGQRVSPWCVWQSKAERSQLAKQKPGQESMGKPWSPALPMAAASAQHRGREYGPGKSQFVNENRAEELHWAVGNLGRDGLEQRHEPVPTSKGSDTWRSSALF